MFFLLLIVTVLSVGTLIEGLGLKVSEKESFKSTKSKYSILIFYIVLTSFLLKDIELIFNIPHHILYLTLMIVVYIKKFRQFKQKNLFILTCVTIFTSSSLVGYLNKSYLLYSAIPIFSISLLFFFTNKRVSK